MTETMLNLGYNNRWIRLVKDILFVCLCLWFLTFRSFFAVLIGVMGLCWYGRDAWFQIKALWQEKHYEPQDNPISRPSTSADDGKITVTRDAKEVDFEKE
jgi:hypothetical protein